MRLAPPIPKTWLDLAALLDPVGRCDDPLANGRPLDWPAICRVAAEHMVAPLLYRTLAAQGRLGAVPNDLGRSLEAFHQLNEARNARLRAVLRDMTRVLNAHGVEPLLLKGSISLLPDQPWQASARMMSDIDIALMNAEPERGEEALRAAGYWRARNQGPDKFRHGHHLAPLFHPSAEGYVEIHRSIMSCKAPLQALPLADVCAAAELVEWDGLRLWIPSIRHRLLHNGLHHQIQDGGFRSERFSLRQVLDFVQLRASPAAADIDWNEVLSQLDALRVGVPFRTYLMVAERLFAQPPPFGVVPLTAARVGEFRMWVGLSCPMLYWLRRASRLPRRLATPGWYSEKYAHLLRRGPHGW